VLNKTNRLVVLAKTLSCRCANHDGILAARVAMWSELAMRAL